MVLVVVFTAWPRLLMEPPPLASFFGFMSRTLTFFLVGMFLFLFWVTGCLCAVRGTEERSPADDIAFWDQVIETDQFLFPALLPGMLRIPGGRMFLLFRCTHYGSLLTPSVPWFISELLPIFVCFISL